MSAGGLHWLTLFRIRIVSGRLERLLADLRIGALRAERLKERLRRLREAL